MKSLLWNRDRVCQIISPEQKFEESTIYIFARYEAQYGDIIINTFTFEIGRLIPCGAQFRVSLHEPLNYYTLRKTENALAELNYKTLSWMHEKSGYHITGFEFIADGKVTESYIPRHFSNRTEYYIDEKYVGVYYSEIYQNEIVRLNNEWLNYVTDLLVIKLPFIKKLKNF